MPSKTVSTKARERRGSIDDEAMASPPDSASQTSEHSAGSDAEDDNADGEDGEVHEVAQPKTTTATTPATITPAEYRAQHKTAPMTDGAKPTAPPPMPYDEPRFSAREWRAHEEEQRARRAQSKQHIEVDIRRDHDYDGSTQNPPRQRPRLGNPPPALPEPVRIFNRLELYDFGVGQPLTRDQALAQRTCCPRTFNCWRRSHTPFIGVPIIADVGRSGDDYERKFWEWVKATKRVDMARMRDPWTVGDVKRVRDMRLRFAKLFCDNQVDADMRAAALSMPVDMTEDQSSSGFSLSGSGSATGTTRGDLARPRGQDQRNLLEGRARQPMSSGYEGTPATSQGVGGYQTGYGRPQSLRRDSDDRHFGPASEAGPAPAAVPYASTSSSQLPLAGWELLQVRQAVVAANEMQQRLTPMEQALHTHDLWLHHQDERLRQAVANAVAQHQDHSRVVTRLVDDHDRLASRLADVESRLARLEWTAPIEPGDGGSQQRSSRRSRSRSRSRPRYRSRSPRNQFFPSPDHHHGDTL